MMMQNGNVFVGVVLMLGALNHSNGFELKWNRTGGDFETANYKYTINDHNGNEQSKQESISNNTFSGEYKTLLPDGRLQIVTYIADGNGFKPRVRYEMSHTVVKKESPEMSPSQLGTNKANENKKVITYKYSVNDNNGNHHSKHETISGNIVSGEYRVLLPNGRTQVVTYKADKDKFQPTIKYLVPKPDTGVKLPDEGMGNKEKIADHSSSKKTEIHRSRGESKFLGSVNKVHRIKTNKGVLEQRESDTTGNKNRRNNQLRHGQKDRYQISLFPSSDVKQYVTLKELSGIVRRAYQKRLLDGTKTICN